MIASTRCRVELVARVALLGRVLVEPNELLLVCNNDQPVVAQKRPSSHIECVPKRRCIVKLVARLISFAIFVEPDKLFLARHDQPTVEQKSILKRLKMQICVQVRRTYRLYINKLSQLF